MKRLGLDVFRGVDGGQNAVRSPNSRMKTTEMLPSEPIFQMKNTHFHLKITGSRGHVSIS